MKLKSLLALLTMAFVSLSSSAALTYTSKVPSNATCSYATDFNNVQLQFSSVVTVDNSVMPTLTNLDTNEVITATGYYFWDWAIPYGQYVVKIEFPTPKKTVVTRLLFLPEVSQKVLKQTKNMCYTTR